MSNTRMIELEDLELIRDVLREHLHNFKNKNVFLTGGTGFFGKWILEAFIYLNQHEGINTNITILSRDPEAFKRLNPKLSQNKCINIIKGSLREFNLKGFCFDYIIHAAEDITSLDNLSTYESKKESLTNLNSLISLANENINARFLFTSSGAVYNPRVNGNEICGIKENDTLDFHSDNLYTNSKLDAESILKDRLECEFIISRCFSFAGPYMGLKSRYAFSYFIDSVINSRDINIKGSGESLRSYMYPSDLTIWLLFLLLNGENRQVYNVGSSISISIEDLARRVVAVTGSDINVNILNQSGMKETFYIPNVDKVISMGMVEHNSLDDIIKKTLKFYR